MRSRLLNRRIGFGASIENAGVILKSYTETKEIIPTLFRSAFYYRLKYIPIIINCDIVKFLNDNSIIYSNGLELYLSNKLFLRLGGKISHDVVINAFNNIKNFDNVILEYSSRISMGLGFVYKKTAIDIGFLNMGYSGYVAGFSITLRK